MQGPATTDAAPLLRLRLQKALESGTEGNAGLECLQLLRFRQCSSLSKAFNSDCNRFGC